MKMLMQQKMQLNTVIKGCCVIIAAAYIVIQGCFIWGCANICTSQYDLCAVFVDSCAKINVLLV